MNNQHLLHLDHGMAELCDRCGLTFGAHKATSSDSGPMSCCPRHEARMDWSESDRTFVPSGRFGHLDRFTPAKDADHSGCERGFCGARE